MPSIKGFGNLRTKSVPQWDRQLRLARVHHEHREELGHLNVLLASHLRCDRRRTSELLGRQHHVGSLLLQKDHDELSRLRRTRVATDRVHVVGPS